MCFCKEMKADYHFNEYKFVQLKLAVCYEYYFLRVIYACSKYSISSLLNPLISWAHAHSYH